jgi:glycerophosphoryl diester phosphodiesterase
LAREDGGALVIAHRGASGELPEHSLAAYRLALEQGADLIEPDLTLTQDGVWIALHDATLNRTTDIADHPEFAERARPDGKGGKAWFPGAFTLAELKTLRLRQGYPGRPRTHDGKESIPTFAEIVQLVREHPAGLRANRGLCPEIKGATDRPSDGPDVVASFVRAVRELGLEHTGAPPVLVQCFHLPTLLALRPKTTLPLLYLSKGEPDAATRERLKGVVRYVGIGAAAVHAANAPAWIGSLRAEGIGVIAWTFRDDQPSPGFATAEAEIRAALASGIAGFFTDYPATGVRVARGLRPSTPPSAP